MRSALCMLLWMSCMTTMVDGLAAKETTTPGVQRSTFGKIHDGREAHLFTLTNKSGMQVAVTDFGATVVSIKVPDRNGKLGDVVLGYDSASGYEDGTAYIGATAGRYANRIAGAKFSLGGQQFTLPKNDHENHLHGGFNKVLWEEEPTADKETAAVRLRYVSKDGEEGYPGNLTVHVLFTLTDRNELRMAYIATTDKKTVVNLTNHSYFNLSESGNVLDYQLSLRASRFTPVDAALIPTGELRNVAGTPFDFREPVAIGKRIEQDDEQLKLGHGYDHNWLLDGGVAKEPRLAATLHDPKSGRVLEVLTTEPGIQVYTANFLDSSVHGKYGRTYERRGAVCLETQHFPDSPNHPDFPSTVLSPGKEFRSVTIYKFSSK